MLIHEQQFERKTCEKKKREGESAMLALVLVN